MGKVFGKHRLVPHADTKHPDLSIGCKFSSFATSGLKFEFVVIGAVDCLAIPETQSPEQCDGLWEHTCFEAFLVAGDGSYIELNFAPSRQWATYRFETYREGMAPGRDLAQPDIYFERGEQRLALSAYFELPPNLSIERIGLSAVIEELDGTKSYWALAHPPGKPDFHHPACFAATLAAPPAA